MQLKLGIILDFFGGKTSLHKILIFLESVYELNLRKKLR